MSLASRRTHPLGLRSLCLGFLFSPILVFAIELHYFGQIALDIRCHIGSTHLTDIESIGVINVSSVRE